MAKHTGRTGDTSKVTELPDAPPDSTGLTARQQRILSFLREARLPAEHPRDR
jgi:hypothetical protein